MRKGEQEVGATFGTNTRHSVPVVQKMMKTEMRTKEALGCSLRTAEMATPRTHMIVTLYTDIPTYLQTQISLNIVSVQYRNTKTSCYKRVK